VPLVCYLYRSGFARFTTARYTNDSSFIDNAIVHLTNVAIQKHSGETSGLKWDLRKLKLYLMAKHGWEKVNTIFEQIQLLIIRTLLSAQKLMINDKHCFEVFGFDILIDQNLSPWLLEVNAYPSVTATTKEDYNLKYALLIDTIKVVDLEGNYTGNEGQIGGYDLIYRGGVVKFESQCVFSSNLGAKNPSITNYQDKTGPQWRTLQTVLANETKIDVPTRLKAKAPLSLSPKPATPARGGVRRVKAATSITKRRPSSTTRTHRTRQRSQSRTTSSKKQGSKSLKEPEE